MTRFEDTPLINISREVCHSQQGTPQEPKVQVEAY